MWARSRKPGATRSELTGFIDEGSEIEGKYAFTGTVMVNGKFQGEIDSPDTLIIGAKAVVNANVRAGTLIVSGELVGNVVAGDRVELKNGARVFGDVEAPVVVVEEGVLFEGRCRMTTVKTAAPKPADSTVVALKR